MPVRRVIVTALRPDQRRATAFRVIGCKRVGDARRSSRISTGFVFERKLAGQSCGVEMSPTGISCRRRHSAIASRYRRPTLSAIKPASRGDLRAIGPSTPKAVTNIPIAVHWSVASNRRGFAPNHRHSSIWRCQINSWGSKEPEGGCAVGACVRDRRNRYARRLARSVPIRFRSVRVLLRGAAARSPWHAGRPIGYLGQIRQADGPFFDGLAVRCLEECWVCCRPTWRSTSARQTPSST